MARAQSWPWTRTASGVLLQGARSGMASSALLLTKPEGHLTNHLHPRSPACAQSIMLNRALISTEHVVLKSKHLWLGSAPIKLRSHVHLSIDASLIATTEETKLESQH